MEVTININSISDKINQEYQKKLEEQKAKYGSSEIFEELQLGMLANSKYEKIKNKMEEVLGKPVWEDYNFRTGKILGILRSILQNSKQKNDLLIITGLNSSVIDAYYKYAGNLPYTDDQNVVNPGRQMDVVKLRQLLPIVGLMLGIPVTEDDLSDITQERWDSLYRRAYERAAETAKCNAANKQEIKYEE